MGEKPDQIERHIQHQRDELGENFNELEQKVKSAFDWRSQFEERPGTMLGLALVGGALLAAVLPSTSRITSSVSSGARSFSDRWSPYTNRESSPSTSASESGAPSSNAYSAYTNAGPQTSDTWNNLKNAAISVATSRISQFIDELVPGFTEHYKKAASSQSTTPFASIPTQQERNWQKPNGGTDYGSHS